MAHSFTYGGLLLLSSAMVAPAALAQAAQEEPVETHLAQVAGAADGEIELAMADAADQEIVISGRRIPDAIRQSAEVVSVLSNEDIERMGEGDIAGALQRVTGLSVVGGRFVYVRGLGERYSLALLNGSPLPSPEPLRRVVPLDIFPTGLIAGSVVQKSYSADYPGEFGGGVIDLSTKSAVDEPFVSIGASIGMDTETTGQLGYTYYGSDTDWTGFDDGTRDIPSGLEAAMGSGKLIVVGQNFSEDALKDMTASLVNAPTTLIQRNRNIPPNWGASLSAGASQDLGGDTLSLLVSAGYSNGWHTKGGLQQVAAGITPVDGVDTIRPDIDYRFLSTENRILVNGLASVGLELGEHRFRWTNLFIRDTLKEARIQSGVNEVNVGSSPVNIGNTAWYERQLINTQLASELEFGDFDVELRGSYAQAQRESPYERTISYRYDENVGDYVNDLRGPGQSARIAFSDLTDDVYSGGADLSYEIDEINATVQAGYAYLKNERVSTRRDFRYNSLDILPLGVTQERPDYLLSDFNVYTYDIVLTEISGLAGAARYEADLEVHGGYLQAESEIIPSLRVQAGVRYEDGDQSVTPIDLFGTGGEAIIPSRIRNDYWLPAATLTWYMRDDMQLRLHGSKTIARPQFRELAPQQYSDPETDRTYFGNQFLTDSELINAEARYEWYFAQDQRFSLAGFYKKIDRPIEAITFQQGGTFFTTFANAPEAQIYGAEVDLQKFFPLGGVGPGAFFQARRLVLIGNYTFSDSKLKVGPDDTTIPVGTAGMPVPATNVFDDGTPLTGQSRHIANLQLGLENTDRLSQQTVMVSYSSRRVTSRGIGDQPDIYEYPGIHLDFVWREGFELWGTEGELKFEARNLTGEDYEEYQTLNGSRVDYNTYDLGRTFSLGVTVKL